MERFCALKSEASSPVPSIKDIVSDVTDDKNAAFFKAGNFLASGPPLHPEYVCVAIRDLVEMSPLGKQAGEDELKASVSFKWLYILFTLSTRRISEDTELEKAKNAFLFGKVRDFVVNMDPNVPGAAQFAVGALCFAARLLDAFPDSDKGFADEQLFKKLMDLIRVKSFPPVVVGISDFSIPELFSFLCPVTRAYLPPANLFADMSLVVRAAVLRFLYRIVRYVKPVTMLDDFKMAVQEMGVGELTAGLARRVLVLLFDGDEAKAAEYSNAIQFLLMGREIGKYCQETNGFANILGYNGLIGLSKLMKDLLSIAEECPVDWKKFLDAHTDVVANIESIITSEYDSSFIISSVKLLRLGMVPFHNLEFLVDMFISSGSSALRDELSGLLLGQPDATAAAISNKFAAVCRYGSRSEFFFTFLAQLLQKVSDPGKILSNLMKSIKDEFAVVQLHPNSHIYTQLANYIAVSGSYLDEQPCDVCNNPEREPKPMKLDEVRDGSKFTHDTILTKLKSPLLISSFMLSMGLKKKSRIPRIVGIYVSSAELKDANGLLDQDPEWMHVADINVTKDGKAGAVKLPLQIFATCLKFEFSSFWEEGSEGSVLRCQACEAEIVDRVHGHCPRCGENAYHCRVCRHINYNRLDGFICCECGASNYVSMDWTITAIKSFSHSRVVSPEDVTESLAKSDELLEEAHTIFANLSKFKQEVIATLSPANSMAINEKIHTLNLLYNEKCKECSVNLTGIVQHVSAIRYAIATYLNLLNGRCPSSEANMCYNCRATYIKNGLAFLAKAAEHRKLEDADTRLLMSFVDSAAFTGAAVGALVQCCRVRPDLTQQVVLLFKESLPNPSPHIVRLLCDVAKISDGFILQRFRAVTHAITLSIELMHSSGSITTSVLEPMVASVLSSSLIIRKASEYELVRTFNAWNKKRQVQKIDPLDVLPHDVIKCLLLDCGSANVRKSVADLLIDASLLSPDHFTRVYDFILKVLEGVTSVTVQSEQWIQILTTLLKSPKQQCHAMISGLFRQLLDLFISEAEKVLAMEHTLVLDLSVGSSICTLTQMLSVFASGINTRYILRKQEKYFIQLVQIFMRLRSLIIQRSKYIDICLRALREVISLVIGETFVIDPESDVVVPNPLGIRKFITVAVECIKYGHVSVVHELVNFMFPKPEVLNVPILTRKIRTQEDYIPGRVPKNPVSSKTIGRLMRDIKNKICIDLNMRAMIDDDHGMELLVCNNIISLDLPIDDVYTNVWVPAEGETPMVVVFRLQGLDGEATEPMITSFPSTQRDDVSPEIKFSYTSVLCETNGFTPFLEALEKDMSNGFVADVMQCMQAFNAVKENRRKLAEIGGIDLGFKALKTVINQSPKVELIESILSFILALIREVPTAEKQPEEHIDLVFSILGTQIIKDNESLLSPLLALLPPLASGSQALMSKVLTMFTEGLRKQGAESSANIFESYSSLRLLNGFGEFALALPVNDSGNVIRDGILKLSFVDDAIKFVQKNFPLVDGKKDPKVWDESVNIPVLPALFKVLSGMVCCHKDTQQLILDNNMVPLLLLLEDVVSKNSIGECVSVLLTRAMEEPSVCAPVIAELREARERGNQERARLEREKTIAEAEKLSPALLKMMESLEEDDGWACCICKEGYCFMPDDVLGFYVMEKSVKDFYSTSTHFICVHQKCHDRSQPPRTHRIGQLQSSDDWSAALVRNCERPCNAIFPIPSATISRENYRTGIINFYKNFGKGGSAWQMLIRDVAYSLQLVSNPSCDELAKSWMAIPKAISLLPFLIYADHLILDSPGQPQGSYRAQLQRNFYKNLESDLPLAFASTFWILTLEEWNYVKLDVLHHLLKSLGISQELSDADLFAAVKPVLLQYVLADKIQAILKKPSMKEPEVNDGKIVPSSTIDAPWIEEFLKSMENDGMATWTAWNDLGEEYDDEIKGMQDARTAFVYTDDLNKVAPDGADPLPWIRAHLH